MRNFFGSDRLRELCSKNNWFTTGGDLRFSRLLEANEFCVDIDTLATAIWICSESVDRSSILEILRVESLPHIRILALSDALRHGGFEEWEIEQIVLAVSNSDLNHTVYKTV